MEFDSIIWGAFIPLNQSVQTSLPTFDLGLGERIHLNHLVVQIAGKGHERFGNVAEGTDGILIEQNLWRPLSIG
jgi:hypothetical protein